VGTAGNVSDVTQAHSLLHGHEVSAFGDAGYQGVEKRAENIGKSVTWHVAMKRAKRKALPKNRGRMTEKLAHLKASVHAKLSIRSMSSRTCSVIGRLVTVAGRKTPLSCTRCSASPIWCWQADVFALLNPEVGPERHKA
jgi:IS5 family transposase